MASASSVSPSHGELLVLLRTGGPRTRGELLATTRLARSTLVERLDTLQRLRLVRPAGRRRPAGGRPATVLAFDHTSRRTLVVDLGADRAILALTDLSAALLAVERIAVDLTREPATVVDEVVGAARRLVADHGAGEEGLLGVGVCFPGLVGSRPGRIEAPAVLAAWDAFPLGDVFRRAFDAPALLLNDAHALAYGEHLADGRRRTIIAVKVATGIGAGLVVDGRLHQGDSHGAGQFGHMRVPGLDAACTCGQHGCLATVASGRAMLRDLAPDGITTLDGLADAAAAGHPAAVATLRRAGQAVGAVLSGVATMVDPGAILLGGKLGTLEPFLEAARAEIATLTYQRTAREVHVGPAMLGDTATVTGLAALLVDTHLSASCVDAMVAGRDGS